MFKRKAQAYFKPGKMNKTESAYAQHLELLKKANEILWYEFEALKFKLADKTFYTPDFIVLNKDNVLEAHEVKGFWRDDARVKIKVAANKFPVKFIAISKKKKAWEYEYF